MTLFATPEEHAAHPPASWQVIHAGQRSWNLETAPGVAIHTYRTREAAEAAKVSGQWVDLWERESRWYAGEAIPHWRLWADVKAERERRAARLQERYRGYGIKFALDAEMRLGDADAEPTDANLAAVLATCARRPHPTEYAAIRGHVLAYRANPEVHGR